MSLFKFMKETGDKVMRESNEKKADEAKSFLASLGLPVNDLDIQMENDESIAVRGTVDNQETREKLVLALGNIRGIGAVNDALEVSQAQPQATFYTVKPGDTLSKIAKAHYGDAMKYPEIFEANKPMLKDPDKIYPGQMLRIPTLD